MRSLIIAFYVTLVLLVLLVLGALVTGLLSLTISSLPLMGWFQHWMTLPLLILVFYLLPADVLVWKRPYFIRGSALIDVSALRVWNVIFPEPGKPHFQPTVTKVTALEGVPERVDLHFHSNLSDDELPPLQAVIDDAEMGSYYRLSYLNNQAFPLFSRDLKHSEYLLEPEGGQTRLTIVEKLDKLRITTVLALLFLNPCRDSTTTIKAICEGTEDPSWMGWAFGKFVQGDAAQNSAFSPVNTIAFLVCAMLTGVTLLMVTGLIYWMPEAL